MTLSGFLNRLAGSTAIAAALVDGGRRMNRAFQADGKLTQRISLTAGGEPR